jgi:hypothetical protein
MAHSYLLVDNDSDSEDSEDDSYTNSQINSEDNYADSNLAAGGGGDTTINNDNELQEPATMFEDNALPDMEGSDVDMRDIQSPEPGE